MDPRLHTIVSNPPSIQSLLESLYPPDVIVFAAPAAFAVDPLFPEEEAAVVNALDKRRREFAVGRACAREALRRLGTPAGPIPSRPDRAPVWPPGIVGTITHCTGLVAAAVASRDQFEGIGLDAESRERPLESNLDRFIRTPAERSTMDRLLLPAELDVVRLVFSAKESVHKCIAPMSGITLGFHDVELDVDVGDGRFRARLVGQQDDRLPDFARLSGRFVVTDELVLTTVVVAAE
jgi:4'-phosphopantetheinyl transferase EntD